MSAWYRMVVVDDQPAEIEGIKRLLDWQELGIEIVGHATDGREGYNLCLTVEPHLIISDVVMPLCDGIRMIRDLSASLSGFRTIFISSFDDFKFLSEAIESGAHRYVLKPLLPGELEDAVRSAVESLDADRARIEENKRLRSLVERHRGDFRKRTVRGALLGEPAVADAELGELLQLPAPPYQVLAVEVEAGDESALALPALGHLEEAMRGSGLLVELSVNRAAIVLHGGAVTTGGSVDALMPTVRRLERELGVTLRAGLGEPVASLDDLGGSYQTARAALGSAPESDSGVARYRDVTFEDRSDVLDFRAVLGLVRDCVFDNGGVGCAGAVEQILARPESPDALLLGSASIVHALHVIRERTGFAGGLTVAELLHDADDVRTEPEALRRRLVEEIERLRSEIATEEGDRPSQVVADMERYIADHFTEPIQVQDVAYHVELSPGYANLLYRSATGRTLHQVITNLRMQRAKELLETGAEMIQDVATKCGFTSSGYFITVFRRHFGVTPGEFKRR